VAIVRKVLPKSVPLSKPRRQYGLPSRNCQINENE
jgi:hypothetical protein